MLIGPGEPAQVLHRDSGNWPFAIKPQWPDAPEITVSMMLALDDVSEVLGATRVIRGSHRRKDHNREGSPDETIAAEPPSGSAMIYSGHVMHGGSANQTEDKWRLAKHLSMVVGWLTPEEASAVKYSQDDVENMSNRARRLLGFSSYSPTASPNRLWLTDFEPL